MRMEEASNRSLLYRIEQGVMAQAAKSQSSLLSKESDDFFFMKPDWRPIGQEAVMSKTHLEQQSLQLEQSLSKAKESFGNGLGGPHSERNNNTLMMAIAQ
eukprot:gene3981-14472_t